MTGAVYARSNQEGQEERVRDQINSCLLFANQREIFVEQKHIYTDLAMSGALRDRPGLNRLLQAAASKSFDFVIVSDLSRFSRNNAYLQYIMNQLSFADINLLTVDGVSTMEDSVSNLTAQLAAIINENYIYNLRAKTLRGQIHQKQLGYFFNELIFGYGYEASGDVISMNRSCHTLNNIFIVSQEAEKVLKVFHMYADGIPLANIANDLNSNTHLNKQWTVRTLRKMIRNEKYIGRWPWGKTSRIRDRGTGKIHRVVREVPLFDGTFEELRIVPQGLWDQAQTKLFDGKK